MPVQANHAFMVAATPGVVGISRWLAPELINPPRKKGRRQPAGTKRADIFAFAMLGIEVFTGELPFGDVRHETAILMIAQGKRPEKPSGAESRGFTTEIWRFTQRCWQQNPTKRPDINTVVNTWRDFCFQEQWVAYLKVEERLLTLAIGHVHPHLLQTPTRKSTCTSPFQNLLVRCYCFGLARLCTESDPGKRKKMWSCGLF